VPPAGQTPGQGRWQGAESSRWQGLWAKAAKKLKVTRNSNHSLSVAENLLQKNLTASDPNHVRVADITYIAIDEGWLYLAVVLGLYLRKVES
jgi:transposase InsO family protein